MTISFLFIALALLLFVLAAIGVASRVHLGWSGMACLAVSMLIGNVVIG